MRRSSDAGVRRGERRGRLERIANASAPWVRKRCQSACAQLAEIPSVAAAARSDVPGLDALDQELATEWSELATRVGHLRALLLLREVSSPHDSVAGSLFVHNLYGQLS